MTIETFEAFILGSMITFVFMKFDEKPIFEYVQDLKIKLSKNKQPTDDYIAINYAE